MSIEISSDDSISSVVNDELPEIDFAGNFVKGLSAVSGPQIFNNLEASIVLSDDDERQTAKDYNFAQSYSFNNHEKGHDALKLKSDTKEANHNDEMHSKRKRQKNDHCVENCNLSSSTNSTDELADHNDDLFDIASCHNDDKVVYLSKNNYANLPSNVGLPCPSTSNSSSGVYSLPTTHNESDDDEDGVLTLVKKKKSTVKIVRGKKACNKVTRETNKKKLENEKVEKRIIKEQQKCYKPGECMKYMYVEIHPDLFMKTLSNELQSVVTQSGAHLIPVVELTDPNIIMWTRRSPTKLVMNSGQVNLGQEVENCDSSLLVLEAKEFYDLFLEKKLTARVSDVITLTNTKVTIVLYGAKEYIRKTVKKGQTNKVTIDEIKMEMALTDLIVSLNCCSMRVENPTQLAELVLQFTKAVAETPYKKAKYQSDEKADFYMRGDNRNCISVDKDGRGLQRWWQQMIARLPLSSLETARAICSEYASPLNLIQALEENADGVTKLEELAVRRTAVPGARNRKVGPGFARKINTFFTATDGSTLLQ